MQWSACVRTRRAASCCILPVRAGRCVFICPKYVLKLAVGISRRGSNQSDRLAVHSLPSDCKLGVELVQKIKMKWKWRSDRGLLNLTFLSSALAAPPPVSSKPKWPSHSRAQSLSSECRRLKTHLFEKYLASSSCSSSIIHPSPVSSSSFPPSWSKNKILPLLSSPFPIFFPFLSLFQDRLIRQTLTFDLSVLDLRLCDVSDGYIAAFSRIRGLNVLVPLRFFFNDTSWIPFIFLREHILSTVNQKYCWFSLLNLHEMHYERLLSYKSH